MAWLVSVQLLLVSLAAAGMIFPGWRPVSAPLDPAEEEIPIIDFEADPPTPPEEQPPPDEPIPPDLPELEEMVEITPVELEALPLDAILEPLPEPPPPPPETPPPERPRPTPPEPQPPSAAPAIFTEAGTGRFPLPPYPDEARRRGWEGRVMLRVAIDENGRAGVPSIEESSGYALLDRTAADWIRRRWRWDAGSPRQYRIPIVFELR